MRLGNERGAAADELLRAAQLEVAPLTEAAPAAVNNAPLSSVMSKTQARSAPLQPLASIPPSASVQAAGEDGVLRHGAIPAARRPGRAPLPHRRPLRRERRGARVPALGGGADRRHGGNLALIDQVMQNAAKLERARISRDIHDITLQPYIGLKLGLEALARKLPPGSPVAGQLAELLAMSTQVITDLRG